MSWRPLVRETGLCMQGEGTLLGGGFVGLRALHAETVSVNQDFSYWSQITHIVAILQSNENGMGTVLPEDK